ncbi:MAG: PQQ-binding-like beta-propeller repeat protein [Pirellulaceae bacterium]
MISMDVERSATFNRLGMQAAGDNRSNSLVALNVPSEGKIRWKVGGETGDLEPQLARVFFLGPPLALGNELYVLGERNSDISLFALDQETGHCCGRSRSRLLTKWKLVSIELADLPGASPSYADGVLVCPTSAGAIVALDLANRSLLWARQFDQAVPDVFSRRGVIIRRNRSNSLETGWLDATVAISNGVVIATPVESNELHAFDLVTGEPAWPKPVSRNAGLYVGAVTDEIVLVVGEDGVQGISLQNGKVSWDIRYRDIQDGSGMELRPSGRGFASQGHYFLPTTSQLLRIEISTGQVVDSLETRQPLGNLVCYQNNLISFSPEGVSAFFQVESLKLLVQSRLAQDANDPWALQHQGMLLLEEGQVAAGLEALRLAVRNYPEDHPRRTMAKAILVDGLLAAMNADYSANAALANEVVDLVEQPEQQRKFLRIIAQSKLASGDISVAFDAYLRLGFDVSSGENSLVESKKFSATLNCVVRNGIAQCLTLASAALRTELDSRIEQTVSKAIDAQDLAMQQRCVEVFHSHRSVAPLALKMAEHAFAEQKLLASEIYAAPLTGQSVCGGTSDVVVDQDSTSER